MKKIIFIPAKNSLRSGGKLGLLHIAIFFCKKYYAKACFLDFRLKVMQKIDFQ